MHMTILSFLCLKKKDPEGSFASEWDKSINFFPLIHSAEKISSFSAIDCILVFLSISDPNFFKNSHFQYYWV